MKKLINQVETVLNEQLQGFVAAHPALRLHRDPVFIARSDAPLAGKVALISGGGSGHEPMHSGFVGDGMLDGAVPGEIFTSPTPDQVVACAQAVDGGKGVLLLVKNYTGDVLNFETAAELLHDMGTEVAFVLTDDDVAVKDSLYTAGRRGVAGTVLLEKLLGTAARRGDDLASLAALGRRLNDQCHSIGIALGACTVPAAGKPSFTLADDEMEFGVGIHGEPGIERRSFKGLDDTVTQMFATLIEHGAYHRTLRLWNGATASWDEVNQEKQPLAKGDHVIALVNNLGSVPLSECYGVYHALARCCADFGLTIARSLVGSYCTSLDMQGISITLLKADDAVLELFDAPVSTPGWSNGGRA